MECGVREASFGSQIVWPREVSESPLRRGMILAVDVLELVWEAGLGSQRVRLCVEFLSFLRR